MHPLTHTTLVGNWATLLLATNKNGEIDYKRMGDEIDILIASSPCGIYSNGTAGEFYTQNEEEFIKTSELLAEKCSAAAIHSYPIVPYLLIRPKYGRHVHESADSIVHKFPADTDAAALHDG